MEFSSTLFFALLLGVILLVLYSVISRGRQTDSTQFDSTDSNILNLPKAGQLPDDSWEGSFPDAENPKVLCINLEIDYVDGAGLETNRKIRAFAFDNDLHGGILIAHCFLRNANRTFRFNRIQLCLNSDTGERISDIASYLNAKFEQTELAT